MPLLLTLPVLLLLLLRDSTPHAPRRVLLHFFLALPLDRCQTYLTYLPCTVRRLVCPVRTRGAPSSLLSSFQERRSAASYKRSLYAVKCLLCARHR